MLEHHTHLLADGINIRLGIGNVCAFKGDRPLGRLLQQVQTAQKGRLTGAGGSYDDQLFTGRNVLGNIVEHQMISE